MNLKDLIKNPWIQGAIGIIVFLIVIPPLIGKSFGNIFSNIGSVFGIKTDAEKQAEQSSIDRVNQAGTQLGYNEKQKADALAKANAIADALNTKKGLTSWIPWEDEEKAVNELIGLTKEEFQLVSEYYSTEKITGGRILTNDLKEYCTEKQRQPIAYLL